jgi:hypothetical protein
LQHFLLFYQKCNRQLAARPGGSPRLDLKHYLNRPGEHLQKYPVFLEAIFCETVESNPDRDCVHEAIAAIQNLQHDAQLRIYEIANFDLRTHLELHEEEEKDLYDDERRFINPSFLSHLAIQLRDEVPRGTHVKGSIPYPRAFTGKDIVVCQCFRRSCLKLAC